MMDAWYSDDYFVARERFRDAVQGLDGRLLSYCVSSQGPGGRELTTDVAIMGAASPSEVVLVSSGLHGVEGFFGSAVQLQLLDDLRRQDTFRRSKSWVLVHGLNPYGFAWLRRTDELNVDLNRNFLMGVDGFAGSPLGYAELDPILNPRQWMDRWDPMVFATRGAWLVWRRGLQQLKTIVAMGQYEFPRGLFYGGSRHSAAVSLLRENLTDWLEAARGVLHLDFHTGLGRWASYRLLAQGDIGPERCLELQRHFGADHVEFSDSIRVAYPVRGSVGPWCQHHLSHVDYTYLCAEFGTYSPLRILAGLRKENHAHHWLPGDPEWNLQAKFELREMFCPRSVRWRSLVLARSRHILMQAQDWRPPSAGSNP